MKRTELVKRIRRIAKTKNVPVAFEEGGSHTIVRFDGPRSLCWAATTRSPNAPHEVPCGTPRDGRSEMPRSAAKTTRRAALPTAYEVYAERSDDWWAIEFPSVDDRIHSQARRLDQIPELAAEAITMWFADEDGRQVLPEQIQVVPVVDNEFSRILVRARNEREQAEAVAASARSAMLDVVRAGRHAGLPVRDIGELLGVSYQYAARLARSRRPASS